MTLLLKWSNKGLGPICCSLTMVATDPDNWSASLQNNFGLRLGLLLLSEVAAMSFVGPTVLLAISICHAIKNYRLHGGWGPEDCPLQPVSLLFLVAVFMDSVQALAGILAARWAFYGKVTEGSYCTTQAVLQQIGDVGVSWFTIAIAVMTFLQTMFPGKLSRSQARRLAVAMIALISSLSFLSSLSPQRLSTLLWKNAWCWIADGTVESSRLKIGSEYAYFWLAAIVTSVLYGIIVVNWLREATAKRDRRLLRDAMFMGWYPIAYIVEIFPISLVRFLEWRPKSPGPRHGFIIAADFLFAASGPSMSSCGSSQAADSVSRNPLRTRRETIVSGNLILWGRHLLLQGDTISYGGGDSGWGVVLFPSELP
ncbi:hypothetical protein BS47DRAFT_895225 [Hydnum rufescens UP504]|uniref:G-protein coupled receptors family 1 profile domain-containing protein n=1 Tax=Hydnum rufescens UP504 TaxID=1448309 RepID=A0A9P6AC69_9AGAM|nr:hypothetical protein BS47DRAFT_895225 [Hydnum rufescens UP504]